MHGDICQHFTIHFDACFLETRNKATVRQAVLPGCSIDAHNPQTTELALTLPAISVGVLSCLDDGLLGYLKRAAARAIVAFCSF